jgi:TPR repeat protein
LHRYAQAGLFGTSKTAAFLEKCRQLADAGDTQAMLQLAEGYELGYFPGHVLLAMPKDQHESIRYYTLAAGLGEKTALRYVYDAYRLGSRGVSKNHGRADQYLNKAAQFGSDGQSCCWHRHEKNQRRKKP